nr:MAG TPA: hypothetical protein [Caudoviricetes sp.]
MNAQQMIARIQAKLQPSEELVINVTYARGRTLVQSYKVTPNKVEYLGHSWNGYGNVRSIYAQRVLNA